MRNLWFLRKIPSESSDSIPRGGSLLGNRIGHRRNVTRAHDHEQIAFFCGRLQIGTKRIAVGKIGGVRNAVGKLGGGNAVGICFTCGVNVDEADLVAVAECRDEILKQLSRAGIGVRLIDTAQPTAIHAACTGKRRADLGRMVTEVIVDGNAHVTVFQSTLIFHAAAGTGKGGQSRGNDVGVKTAAVGSSSTRQRVEHVVLTGNGKMDAAEILSVTEDREGGASVGIGDIHGAVVGVGRVDAEGHMVRVAAADAVHDVFVVGVDDVVAVLARDLHIFMEGFLDLIEGLEVVGMVHFLIEDDGDARSEGQEGVLVFACFEDEVLARTRMEVAAKLGNRRTDQNGGIALGVQKEMGEVEPIFLSRFSTHFLSDSFTSSL